MKVLCNVDVTICKVQNSIISTLKVGKLGWIEYIDKDVCTALTYFGFHIEHKVAKYTQMFSKVYFFSTRSLFVGWSRKLKYTEQILKRYHRILADFPQILLTITFFSPFLLWFLSFFLSKQKIYILIHIWLCGGLVIKKFPLGRFSETRLLWFWLNRSYN